MIKWIRLQVDGHTMVEFRNGSMACSCGQERGVTPNLHYPPSAEISDRWYPR